MYCGIVYICIIIINKLKLKIMKTEFTVSFINEFGSYIDRKLKCETGLNPEQTFKNSLNSLTKKISKTWENISFNQDEHNISVRKYWLHETGFDFSNSVLITKLNK